MKKTLTLTVTLTALLALGACGTFKGPKKTPTLGDRVPILVSENGAEADKTIAEVEVLLPPAETNANWAQPGGDASKSMGHITLGASPTRLWSARIRGGTPKLRLGAAPVIADGKLFVVDVNATVTAFAADTGRKLWSTEIFGDKKNREARFGGGASFDDGKIFATDGLGDVIALSAADGKMLWRVKPGGPLRGSPTVSNGSVYVLSQDNQLFALSQTDGAVQWTQTGTLESQGVFGVAAPATGRGTVVAGFSSGELNAYRYENGRTLWADTLSRTSVTTSVSSIADIDASPVIDQDRVYAIGEGGRMVALELTTGKRLWELNIAGISTPWIAGEWLFVSTDDGRMICMSRANGKIRWITDIGGFKNKKKRTNPIYWSGPVLASGRLIVVNSRGEILSVKATNGELGSKIKGGIPFSLPPVVANNILYVLDSKGKITAYR
ncbi:MAG: PQQ-like beta-propeller repeat protein [Sphingomonas sp.]|uniref:outer membrane protein assembly factor BamB family protein n=1 Tax=Sphingomonas sp. TaxID=28214 RepID=UPI0025F31232|nr:PQQ-like beta-propeller repeat protein [Sphingomonas sp.]MBY0283629.1 PQQ-like beta-propeller repeat protein [Sphingomonas sp.]